MIQEEIINGLIYIVKYDDKGQVVYKKLKAPELTEEQKAQEAEAEKQRAEEAEKNRPATVAMFEELAAQVTKTQNEIIDDYTMELIAEGVIV